LTTSSLSSRTQKPNTENQTARWPNYAKSQRFLSPKSKTLTSSEPKGERAKTQLAQEQLQADFE